MDEWDDISPEERALAEEWARELDRMQSRSDSNAAEKEGAESEADESTSSSAASTSTTSPENEESEALFALRATSALLSAAGDFELSGQAERRGRNEVLRLATEQQERAKAEASKRSSADGLKKTDDTRHPSGPAATDTGLGWLRQLGLWLPVPVVGALALVWGMERQADHAAAPSSAGQTTLAEAPATAADAPRRALLAEDAEESSDAEAAPSAHAAEREWGALAKKSEVARSEEGTDSAASRAQSATQRRWHRGQTPARLLRAQARVLAARGTDGEGASARADYDAELRDYRSLLLARLEMEGQ